MLYLVLTVLGLSAVSADWSLQIGLQSFNVPDDKLLGGSSCDTNAWYCNPSITPLDCGKCDIYLQVCVDPKTPNNSNPLTCSTGWVATSLLTRNADSVATTFGQTYGQYRNPMTFLRRGDWQGAYIKLIAWDRDAISAPDVIDHLMFDIFELPNGARTKVALNHTRGTNVQPASWQFMYNVQCMGSSSPSCHGTYSSCSDIPPCQNGGTCITAQSNAICQCPPGYSGASCEIDVWCNAMVCHNGATCQHRGGAAFCNCPLFAAGTHCENVLNCGGNITMGSNSSGLIYNPSYPKNVADYAQCAWYLTAPAFGHVSLSFSHFVFGKTSLPCVNNSVTVFDGIPGVGSFSFLGQICPNTVINSNNGTFASKSRVMSIFYKTGAQGNGFLANYHAVVQNACNGVNCGANSTCLNEGSQYFCVCPKGQIGGTNTKCATNPNACPANFPSVCQNGGSCSLNGNTVTCSCLPGFTGNKCETSTTLPLL